MISAIAVDDEPKALQVITSLATRVPFLQLAATFVDPWKALRYVNDHSVQLIFLDISMPDISGLEVSRALHSENVSIIFTTAHSEYALESYEVEAVDYLLKPFSFVRFHTAVTKVRERLGSQQSFFFVNTGNQHRRVFYQDIRYVAGSGNYVTYHLEKEQILVRSTIKEALANLPTTHFAQIQRSYVVSLVHIEKIQDNHVYIGGTRLSVGPTYKDLFRSTIVGFSS